MITESNVEKAKKLIKQSKKPIIIKAQDDIFNRKIIEYGKFDIFLSPEAGNRKNSVKNLDSGLNEVLARIASKNNIAIGIDIEKISRLNKEDKAGVLEKIKQNIKICRKSKAKIRAINQKDKNNAFALLISLGASTQQAKEAVY